MQLPMDKQFREWVLRGITAPIFVASTRLAPRVAARMGLWAAGMVVNAAWDELEAVKHLHFAMSLAFAKFARLVENSGCFQRRKETEDAFAQFDTDGETPPLPGVCPLPSWLKPVPLPWELLRWWRPRGVSRAGGGPGPAGGQGDKGLCPPPHPPTHTHPHTHTHTQTQTQTP